LLEVLHNDLVVHDLVTDIDRPAPFIEGTLDRLDCAFDTSTEATRATKEDLHWGD
jgi:hypothetical protein